MEDQLDLLSDDKLWDILDNCSNDIKVEKTKQDIYNQSCLECKSANIIYTTNRGSYICNDCGCESKEILDDSPEWNNYDDKKSDSRCGAPSNAFYPKSSLGTTINIPGYSKVKMLRNWGQVPYRERSLAEVLNDIDSKCKKYNITKAVIDNAKILYKNIRETKHESGTNKGKNVIIRGINRKQIIAACFYFGSVLQKIPRSTKEVADIFNLEIKQITKGCRKFLEIMKDNFIVFDIKPSYGSDFVDRFGSKIKLSKNVIKLAKTISINTTKLDIASDHQATSIAAASILLATIILKEDINKKAISDIFDISDVTITKTYKKIFPYQKIVVDDELTNKFNYKINLKLMSHELENDEILYETITETDTETETETESDIVTEIIETESETDILIRKLNQSSNNTIQIEEEEIDDYLDESDIIKKDNTQSKKNKLLLIQEDRNNRKLNKLKLKEIKLKLKLEIKENKKILNNKQLQDNNIVGENTIKKKRGRPKKINTPDIN
jgi:transcription initiation factor TFIIB